MTWCNNSSDVERGIELITPNIIPITSPTTNDAVNVTTHHTKSPEIRTITCPSCGHNIQFQDQGGIQDLPGLPAGVKFDPNDQEILEHLDAKVQSDVRKLHPLIDEFIPTLEGENGICYTHPEKLPGVSKDGQVRHFFHRPSKAYTTGTRKRRKVQTEEEGSETRWHKTGKTRGINVGGAVKGFKKILVLYTNYGRQKKPEKTNWVMHQYHLGSNEEEKDGELVVSKVFYQTQPRQCGNSIIMIKDPYPYEETSSLIMTTHHHHHHHHRHPTASVVLNNNSTSCDEIVAAAAAALPKNNNNNNNNAAAAAAASASLNHNHNNNNNNNNNNVDYYNGGGFISSYEHMVVHNSSNNRESSPQLIPNMVVQADTSSFIRLAMDSNKARMIDRK